MKITRIAAVSGGLALAGAAVAQTTAGDTTVKQGTTGSGIIKPERPGATASSAASTKNATAADARKEGADASTSTGPPPRDRRLKALQGADSAALPNVDAAAAANQVQIPDYPPPDGDQAPAGSTAAPPPR
jgi:hypothetical protein